MFQRLNRFKTIESKPRTLLLGLFSLLGFDFIVDILLSSLTISTTSTTTTTTVSVMTVGTIVTCYTSTMFLSTTACSSKRKRRVPGFLADDDDDGSPFNISPSQTERYCSIINSKQNPSVILLNINYSIEPSVSVDSTRDDVYSRGGRALLFPSFNQLSDNSLQYPYQSPSFGYPIRKNSRVITETEYISTSTSTSYAFYTTTATKVISLLASTNALSCLPRGFTLC